jgi:hypothetical protein
VGCVIWLVLSDGSGCDLYCSAPGSDELDEGYKSNPEVFSSWRNRTSSLPSYFDRGRSKTCLDAYGVPELDRSIVHIIQLLVPLNVPIDELATDLLSRSHAIGIIAVVGASENRSRQTTSASYMIASLSRYE